MEMFLKLFKTIILHKNALTSLNKYFLPSYVVKLFEKFQFFRLLNKQLCQFTSRQLFFDVNYL